MKKSVILLLTALLLLSVAACGKGGKDNDKETEPPENAVLTDSNVPLDLGAEVWDFSEAQTAQ